jgi:nucleoid DNA-binding protein
MPLTQAQLQREIAQRADLAAADVKRMFEALEEVVLDEIGNAQKVKIGNLVQLTVALKAATKARRSLAR